MTINDLYTNSRTEKAVFLAGTSLRMRSENPDVADLQSVTQQQQGNNTHSNI